MASLTLGTAALLPATSLADALTYGLQAEHYDLDSGSITNFAVSGEYAIGEEALGASFSGLAQHQVNGAGTDDTRIEISALPYWRPFDWMIVGGHVAAETRAERDGSTSLGLRLGFGQSIGFSGEILFGETSYGDGTTNKGIGVRYAAPSGWELGGLFQKDTLNGQVDRDYYRTEISYSRPLSGLNGASLLLALGGVRYDALDENGASVRIGLRFGGVPASPFRLRNGILQELPRF